MDIITPCQKAATLICQFNQSCNSFALWFPSFVSTQDAIIKFFVFALIAILCIENVSENNQW